MSAWEEVSRFFEEHEGLALRARIVGYRSDGTIVSGRVEDGSGFDPAGLTLRWYHDSDFRFRRTTIFSLLNWEPVLSSDRFTLKRLFPDTIAFFGIPDRDVDEYDVVFFEG